MVPEVKLVCVTQFLRTSDEQVPAEVKLMTLLVSIRVASWSVGLIMSLPSLTKTFSSSKVVCSNWPLLKHR
jgi:hypothetical protein